MSSFRDRFNPEAVHFPSHIRCKILIFCGAAVCLLCLAPSYWIEQPLQPVIIDTVLVVFALVFMLLTWPSNLKVDQFGVSSHSPFPHRRIFIPWKEVASVEIKVLHGGLLSNMGIQNDALIVFSSDGKKISHTALHGDRPRFQHELEIHGVMITAENEDPSEGE